MFKSVSRLIIQDPNCGAHAGVCGVCGEYSEQAWPRNEILQKTTSNITVTFPHNTDAMCEYCVVMWDGGRSNKWNRGLLAVPGMTYFPLIAENAELQTEERPTWVQALRTLDPDSPRVCVLNTDFKKRVWPRAKISHGDHLSMLIHDTSRSISDNRSLSLKLLLDVLAFIEDVYTLGFSKTAIETSLMGIQKQVKVVGFAQTAKLESQLCELRRLQEFTPAVMVAQKHAIQ